jgi:hypothetical protein
MATSGRSSAHPGLERAGRICRAAVVAGRRIMAGTVVVLAVLGAGVGPALAVLVWGPLIGLAAAGVVAVVAGAGTDPLGRRAAWIAGAVGAITPAFWHGLTLLGNGAAVVLIALMVTGAASLITWSADLPRPDQATGVHRHRTYLRRVLTELTEESLLREWRAAERWLGADADPEVRAVASELRADLLDELARRDPDQVARWLRTGDAPEP